jgi:hypothetical protein
MSIVAKIAKKYTQLRTWKTNKKLIVIESDDWGSIRMPSNQVAQSLAIDNPRITQDSYCRYDTLASTDDLTALFDTLTQFKDKNGQHPVLTANTIVANPDFEKIKRSAFETYHYEPFHETIKRQPSGKAVLQLWAQGQASSVFTPQLHGREHVHALAWLAELRAGNQVLLTAFEQGTWGVPCQALTIQRRNNLQAALDVYGLPGEEQFQADWLKESADIFAQYFGYASATFIPPAYIWHKRILALLPTLGIRAIQGIPLQYQPHLDGKAGYQKRLRYTGQSAGYGMHYLVRNVFFEPSLQPQKDWVSETLSGIQRAFDNQQPAIIGSHRLNYIGGLDEQNRLRNLQQLQAILKKVVIRWPEVEFVSSADLLEIMKENYLVY